MEQLNSLMKTSGTIFDEFGNPLAEFEKDACTWAMLSHFSGALGNICDSTSAYPWPADHMALEGGRNTPLSPTREKRPAAFRLPLGLYGLVGWMLTIILIGWLVWASDFMVNLIFVIHATSKSKRGETYRGFV